MILLKIVFFVPTFDLREVKTILIIIFVTIICCRFTEDVYNYLPEANHVWGYIVFQLFCGYSLWDM